jgi:hypothetical protein
MVTARQGVEVKQELLRSMHEKVRDYTPLLLRMKSLTTASAMMEKECLLDLVLRRALCEHKEDDD